jgi:hypothetical protein
MLQTSIDMVRVPVGAGSSGAVRALDRLRYQLLAGLLLAVVLPTTIYHFNDLGLAFRQPSSLNTGIGASVAFIIALYLYRRVVTFPGVGALGYVMPAVVAGYGVVLALFFALRLDYSRFNFGVSFALSVGFLFLLSMYLRQHARENFYVVPSEHALTLISLPGADWNILSAPQLPVERNAVIIADLRADMEESWERLIAEAAVSGLPVYHSKQVQESLTGRVEIEHLSENSFGSLIPNSSYRKIKRLLDVVTSLALLPLVAPLGLIVAALIKLDSP